MATVTQATPSERDETRRCVQHPLQTVRKYIRTYVLLEGAALALLFLAAWFWLGLLLDYGLFRAFAFDWVQELHDVAPNSYGPTTFRVVLLVGLLGLLVGLGVVKVALRWLREFSDPAVALVLERRFPRELGDRLITAVEIAEPAKAKRYGFSPVMVQKTIDDAVARLEHLPVADVFDWARLRRLWLRVALTTVGVAAVVAALWLGLGAVLGASAGPLDVAYQAADVASIYGERTFFLRNSYWPRRAYLEVTRFQQAVNDPTEMRVGRDEQRPDVQVRAVEWVVADRAAPDGWRALLWSDLPALVGQDMVDAVTIPADWPHWFVDLDDLAPTVSASLLPASWQGATTGQAARELAANHALAQSLAQAQAQDAVAELLDWRRWTVDKIFTQEQKQEVRLKLRELPAYAALQEVQARLQELAATGSMSRRLRQLEVPGAVEVYFRGAATKSSATVTALDRKYAVALGALKESVRFRVRGEDYYTPAKRIALVPPPSLTMLAVNKDEPAYLYYRLQGFDQSALRGQRVKIANYAVSTTGEMSTVEVPLGTTLDLWARTDRKLRAPVRVKAPVNREAGTLVPENPVVVHADGEGFSLAFPAVTKPLDFVLEFHDEDNVKGSRRLRVRPVDDQPPEVVNVDLAAVLRKPRFKAEPGKSLQGTPADGFLITPDALLQFNGTLRDDLGLTRAGWLHEVEPIDLELVGAGGKSKEKLPTLVLYGNATQRRLALVASALQVSPLSPVPALATPGYVDWMRETLAFDLSRATVVAKETFVAMEEFQRLLDSKSQDDLPAAALAGKLASDKLPPRRAKWEHQLKDEIGFDLRRQLPRLKASSTDREAQLHYLLKLSVSATDNNVETGPLQTDEQGRQFWGGTSRSKTPLLFLVVSENELLAQIAIEEEVLFERLEKVMEKIKNGLTSTDAQLAKFKSGNPGDLSLVAIRTDEVRKAILDSASTTREVFNDYSRIHLEMFINRVADDRLAKVRDKIVLPLDKIVAPYQGNLAPEDQGLFTRAEDAVQKAYQALEDDSAAPRPANLAGHQANLTELRNHLESLRNELNSVLIAMNEGIAESKLIEALVVMERVQRGHSETLRILHKDQADLLFRELLNPTDPQKK